MQQEAAIAWEVAITWEVAMEWIARLVNAGLTHHGVIHTMAPMTSVA